jgi:hypothetical protein
MKEERRRKIHKTDEFREPKSTAELSVQEQSYNNIKTDTEILSSCKCSVIDLIS